MAVEDPYKTLGVAKTASEKEIRDAYRKLAKRYHPDLNPGDKTAEERFKAISAANSLLSDTEQRARFDRGEIDASGQERQERRYYRNQAETGQGRKYAGGGRHAGPIDPEDLSDIFSDFFGAGGAAAADQGRDRQYVLTVSFLDAVRGATPRLTLPDGRTLDVRVPPGIEEGQVLRLKGQGDPGRNGRPAGDALIEIHIAPHPLFRREGRDIHAELPVTMREAVLGARIEVPTPFGPVTMGVPKHADSGRTLRLRGKGIPAHGARPAGDFYVTIKLVLGPVDAALENFLREHPAGEDETSFNPRRDLMDAV